MNKKLVGELELGEGVFDGARYLRVEFEEERKVSAFTLLNEAKVEIDDTGVDLYQDKGELFTGMDRWAQRCLEKSADIDDLRNELAECRKQLEQKQQLKTAVKATVRNHRGFSVSAAKRVRVFLQKLPAPPPDKLAAFPKTKSSSREMKEFCMMKATGIVRRIDDLGRVVIPKEIRRTMRIREGDPLEIYTSKDGEVIFKKYSLMGGLDEFSAQICEAMSRAAGQTVAIADRDTVIAISGGFKRELLGRHVSQDMERIMEERRIFRAAEGVRAAQATEENDRLFAVLAAPVISEGDAMGAVFFVSEDPQQTLGETEYKLAQTIAAFLGRQLES